MPNYVKFMRGTISAYNKLEKKDDDTLYFLYDNTNPSENEGYLYLGNKFISGPCDDNISTEVINLTDLKDVIIAQDLNYDALLVFDPITQQWKSYSFDSLTFCGATKDLAGLSGLVPAPKAGEQNLFLRADGTWADVNTTKNLVFEIESKINETHQSAIIRAIGDSLISSGDVVIVKDYLVSDLSDQPKYQHTAYIYDGAQWVAMDGNYDAENVYFKSDFLFTEPTGNITISPSGSTVVAAAGKNLKELIETLYQKERNPVISEPSISFINPEDEIYEVGEIITPAYEGIFNEGKYEFDTTTGVSVLNYEAINSIGEKNSNIVGTFQPITITDNLNYYMRLSAATTAGNIPHTNLQNNYNDGQIPSKIYTTTDKYIKGCRKIFFGALNQRDNLDQDMVRTLSSSLNVHNQELIIPIKEDSLRVVIAHPDTEEFKLQYVLDVNDANTNIIDAFDVIEMQILGANNYNSINYIVYILDFAEPYEAINNFKFMI